MCKKSDKFKNLAIRQNMYGNFYINYLKFDLKKLFKIFLSKDTESPAQISLQYYSVVFHFC